MNPITPITPPNVVPLLDAPATASKGGGFQDLLNASIQTVETRNLQAAQAAKQFLSGENDDLHNVAIAAQRAELSAELFLQVRNKIISAYQEIMKMQM